MRHIPAFAALTLPALAALCAVPALAADLGRPAVGYSAPAQNVPAGYEVRKYVMDSGRAYGAPMREYIRLVPLPARDRIVVHGPRGTAEILIDERPDINSPDYIPILK